MALLNIFALAAVFFAFTTYGLKTTDSCENVLRYYHNQDVGLLETPAFAENLNVCGKGVTCCTPAAEDKLSVISMTHIQNAVTRERQSLAAELSDRHTKYNAYFEELIDTAKDSLDIRFEDTYGTLYVDNKNVFMKFFDDLKEYYRGTIIDLSDIFDNFFTILMQRVFKLLHPDHIVDDKYMQCIANNLNVINPFSELPQKLSNQVQRSFIAARTLVHALKTGQRVTEDLEGFYLTAGCVKNFMKMYHCSKCSGQVDVLPCSNTCDGILTECLSVLRGGEFNSAWRKYIEKMMTVVGRLDGSFDIQSVLYPFDVKISEAIMMLQDNKDSIENAVARHCGELTKNPNATSKLLPFSFFEFSFDMSDDDEGDSEINLDSWSTGKDPLSGLQNFNLDGFEYSSQSDTGRTKRSATSDPKRKQRKRRKSKRGRSRKNRSRARDMTLIEYNQQYSVRETQAGMKRLTTLLKEMHESQESMKRFWKNLPKAFCDKNAEREPMKNCWNGNRVTKNIPEIEDNSVYSHNATSFPAANMKRQILVLREISAKLASAYRGVDPAFVDGEVLEIDTFSGDGSGEDEKNVDLPKDRENFLIKHLEKWEIDLIQKALSRSVDMDAKFSEIKHVLRKHPRVVQGDVEVKSDENFGDLSDYQTKQLKKMLEMPDPREPEKPSVRVTVAPKTVSTTSGASSTRLFSLQFLGVPLFLQWFNVKMAMV